MLKPGSQKQVVINQQSLQRGISLVEVMVSFSILMVLMTGLSTVFTSSSNSVRDSQLLSEANDLSQVVLERAFSCRFEEFQAGASEFKPSDLSPDEYPIGGAFDNLLSIVVTVGNDPAEDPRPYHVKVYKKQGAMQTSLLVAHSTMISNNQIQACGGGDGT